MGIQATIYNSDGTYYFVSSRFHCRTDDAKQAYEILSDFGNKAKFERFQGAIAERKETLNQEETKNGRTI